MQTFVIYRLFKSLPLPFFFFLKKTKIVFFSHRNNLSISKRAQGILGRSSDGILPVQACHRHWVQSRLQDDRIQHHFLWTRWSVAPCAPQMYTCVSNQPFPLDMSSDIIYATLELSFIFFFATFLFQHYSSHPLERLMQELNAVRSNSAKWVNLFPSRHWRMKRSLKQNFFFLSYPW